jgi:hypothetical protein
MATNNTGPTKTGNSFLASWGNKLSMVPFASFLGAAFLAVDTTLQSIGLLLQGKPLSALTAAGAGTAATFSAAANSNPIWWGINLISGAATKRSINTHIRKGVEDVTSLVTKPLGIQPTVLRSYPAGIGSVQQAGPGVHASRISAQRGGNAQQDYDAYMRGDGGVAVAQMGGQAGRA